jgi:hypothetical protein
MNEPAAPMESVPWLNVQATGEATGEAFSHQKRTSSTSKNEIVLTFFYVFRYFLPSWIRIRIANPDPDTDPGTPLNPDSYPQNWFFV